MNRKNIFCLALAASAFLAGCATETAAASGGAAAPETRESSAGTPAGNGGGSRQQTGTSYAIGMWIGMSIQEDWESWEFDYNEVVKGMRDVLEGRPPRFSIDDAMAVMQSSHQEMRTRIAAENRRAGDAFLAENGRRNGVMVTESGLQYEVLRQGNGPRPAIRDTAMANYEVKLVNGRVLASTWDDGEPVEIPLGFILPGWAEGMQLMPAGSTFMLYLPPDLGYGEEGIPGIPPNATLIFRVELLSIMENGLPDR